ncbi:uncharacterized protein OCT59_014521 [Rhizophagus irregularis]|nr:hypothetical protein OCT59_014521 [Rhizophagus irregularis]GBC44392.2 hypothetical protein GLOIN_2v1870264 [Rhizophagus irregularis DAOM 181602=DAOM 197198]
MNYTQINVFLSSFLYSEELPSTPPSKIRTINVKTSQNLSSYNEELSLDSDLDVIKSILLMNVFLIFSSQQIPVGLIEPINVDGIKPIYSIPLLKDKKKKMARKYINCDLVDEVLKSYQTQVMLSEKLVYNNVDILSFACSKINRSELSKSPLSISVVNIHNNCTKFLPPDFKRFIADQFHDCETEAVNFTDKMIY